jgi:hypothetical protein
MGDVGVTNRLRQRLAYPSTRSGSAVSSSAGRLTRVDTRYAVDGVLSSHRATLRLFSKFDSSESCDCH